MASTLAVLLLLSAGLFTVKAGFGEDCESYYTIYNEYRPGFKCFFQYCCGDCDNRFCCPSEHLKLTESVQSICAIARLWYFSLKCSLQNASSRLQNSETLTIVLIVVGVVFHIIVFIICCFCPCCCIYKMCKKPRPVAGVQVTTVTNTNLIQQQPVMQGAQCPQYQPVPTQPGYGQPMQTGPYQGQPYAPGPPPSCQVALSPGYPISQSAYDGGQAMYTMQPPAQPGVAYMPSETSNQLAYNPAYVQTPNIGY